MSLNNSNNISQPINVIILNEALFIWIFLIIIFSWLLIDIWGRFFNNFTFTTLKLDEKSSTHTFFIAIILTAIIITMIIYLKYNHCNIENAIFNINDNSDNNSISFGNVAPLGIVN